jgi:hypothetical protein
MKKRKIYALHHIEIHHYSFQTVATNHYSSGIINRKGQEDQSLQDYLLFPLFSDPDRAVFAYIISHAYHQKKTRKRKDG